MRILHIISNLGKAGAETTLLKILLNEKNYEHHVISLKKGGELNSEIIKAKINLYEFNFSFINLFEIFSIFKRVKKINPNLIQSWMYHSDFLASVLKLFYKYNCLWCVRSGTLKLSYKNIFTIILRKICSFISYKFVDNIIFCSKESMFLHEKIGYDKSKSILIPNGYDVNYYNEVLPYKYELKKKFNIPDNSFIISIIGRLHNQKNHIFFLELMKRLCKKDKNFLGAIITSSNFDSKIYKKIKNIINDNKLNQKIIFIDGSSNYNKIINIVDLNIMCSSWGEAFPNVICETMLTKIPNISYNIGDVSNIMVSKDYIIDDLNEDEFVKKINYAYNIKKNFPDQWEKLRERSREHIVLNYKLKFMITKYIHIWRKNFNEKY